MKMGKRLNVISLAICSIVIFCSIIFVLKPAFLWPSKNSNTIGDDGSNEENGLVNAIERFSDVRVVFYDGYYLMEPVLTEKSTVVKDDIVTFTFNEGTDFAEYNDYAKGIMEKAKNPGLGIREIHRRGITGRGVRVAIIDQKLAPNHPEYNGKILEYYTSEYDKVFDDNLESMHGPAVTSLLVGESIGTAPGALLYYAEIPAIPDAKYFAESLRWIIKKNLSLPAEEKIKIVSVSAFPQGFDNRDDWQRAVIEAKENNILVLDVSEFVFPAYYDINDPDNLEKVVPGFPGEVLEDTSKNYLLVPCSIRTQAEEYVDGSPSYMYSGQGGISWGIPYAAGVLALGWEIKPDLSPDEIVDLLWDTAHVKADGYKVINPLAFIEEIQKKP